uniref:TAFA chemokine like family member 5 n=1 Tax=Rattus norvegicus TaxID=10116 RepID=A0ABK0LNB7_RAT
ALPEIHLCGSSVGNEGKSALSVYNIYVQGARALFLVKNFPRQLAESPEAWPCLVGESCFEKAANLLPSGCTTLRCQQLWLRTPLLHTLAGIWYLGRTWRFSIVIGQLAAGTCEIVTLDRDSSQPRRTIARQTARCACRKGQIAGTTRARPACVDARIIKTKQWCDMLPCLEGEGCDLLINRSGWTCTQPGGRIKTTTVS